MNSASSNSRNCPGASGHGLLASFALPDSNRLSLDCVLSAECADVSGVLGDFHLLDLLSEGSTISSSVLAGDADLCRQSVSCQECNRIVAGSLFVRFVMVAVIHEN